MTRKPDIDLTVQEQELLASVSFNPQSHSEWTRVLAPMTELAERLLDRRGIPEIRWRYFVDPDCNPCGRGKSIKDVFEKNGTCGDEILRHPHFLEYLEYFIYGPNLPRETIAAFQEVAALGGHLSGRDLLDLAPAARALVRRERLDPRKASDEFFKLALECGAPPWSADGLRKGIRATRATGNR